MFIVVVYDVKTESLGGEKRLRKVSKACQKRGQRVQNSVFECLIDPAEYAKFIDELLSVVDLEQDSIRVYKMGNNYKDKIMHYGAKESYFPEDSLIV